MTEASSHAVSAERRCTCPFCLKGQPAWCIAFLAQNEVDPVTCKEGVSDSLQTDHK